MGVADWQWQRQETDQCMTELQRQTMVNSEGEYEGTGRPEVGDRVEATSEVDHITDFATSVYS